ncbi:MAG TPA: hypothetical protein VFG04_25215 [Planctomycetaceae bacterium]|jgi:hypothetical protein|nr:hypothetical protein [Planctomycetaceae bacterium]
MASRKPTPSIADNLNIYLTYDQAVQAATNILKKAELLKGKKQRVVQVWAKKGAHKLYFGLTDAVQKGTQTAWDEPRD